MKKAAFIISFFLVFFLALPPLAGKLKWKMSLEAAGGFPYQIGLTDVTVTACTPTPCPGTCMCTGGSLCMFKDVATCATYSDVLGTPAGGAGSGALFTNAAIAQAGLSSGGQLIAGGMSSVAMDSGVLASAGGCSGCSASLDKPKNLAYKILDWLDDFIIAGNKLSSE